jgi:hypothetical protein
VLAVVTLGVLGAGRGFGLGGAVSDAGGVVDNEGTFVPSGPDDAPAAAGSAPATTATSTHAAVRRKDIGPEL